MVPDPAPAPTSRAPLAALSAAKEMVERATDAASAAICAARAIARRPRAPRNILHPPPRDPARVVGPILSVIGHYGAIKSLQQIRFRTSPVAFAQQSRQSLLLLRQVIMRVLGSS